VTKDHDVLVLGAGLAGMRAALEAARDGADVAIVTKVHPIRSHSSAAQGGINAAISETDSWESHAFDTVKGSDYLADQDAVEVMAQEAPRDIIEFEHMGVIFHRGPDGRLDTRAFGGASQARTYFVGDITGQALLVTLYDQILKAGVKVYEEWFATSLYLEDGACRGMVAIEMITGELHLLRAKAVIVASGGLGRLYEPSTNALICTGDGYSLAYRAGAPLMDMEMVQYHPTTLAGSGFLMTEAARGEGAYLLNSLGDRFMKRYAPNKMPSGVKRRYFELIRSGVRGSVAARRVGVSLSCGCAGMGICPQVPTWPFLIAASSVLSAPDWPANFCAMALKAGPTSFWSMLWQEKQSLPRAAASPPEGVSLAAIATATQVSRAKPIAPSAEKLRRDFVGIMRIVIMRPLKIASEITGW